MVMSFFPIWYYDQSYVTTLWLFLFWVRCYNCLRVIQFIIIFKMPTMKKFLTKKIHILDLIENILWEKVEPNIN